MEKNARFEQIWRIRKGKKELKQEEPLHEACHHYDIERVDDKISKDVRESSDASLEELMIMRNYFPLMDEFLPSAAEKLRTNMQSYASNKGSMDEFVYDLYIVNIIGMDDGEAIHPFPLIQVDEDDEFYDGPDDTDNDSEDSNAEDNSLNDYPDEELLEEDESVADKSDMQSDEEEDGDESSTDSIKPEDLLNFGRAIDMEDGDFTVDFDDEYDDVDETDDDSMDDDL